MGLLKWMARGASGALGRVKQIYGSKPTESGGLIKRTAGFLAKSGAKRAATAALGGGLVTAAAGTAVAGGAILAKRSMDRRRIARERQEAKQAMQVIPPAPNVGAAAGGAGIAAYAKEKWAGLSTPAKVGVAAAGTAALLYGAEQIAEKLGVRGGAGFIGARPKKRKSRKRKSRRMATRRRVRRARARGGKRVSFTTADGRRVSFTARGGGSRRRRRRGNLSKDELSRIMRVIRKEARD